MYKRTLLLALVALTFGGHALAQSARGRINAKIPAQQAVEFAGREGTVCGKVESAKHATNSDGEPTFLYMGGQFPKHTFSVRIWGKDRAGFDPAPETLAGSVVCATGRITASSNRAEIVVSNPSRLEVN